MKIENLPFLVFLQIGPSFFGCTQKCREISKNALSQHVAFACLRCLAGHKVGKEVTRRIGEKKRKERELEDKGGNERTREKGRLGSPESRRPVTPEVAKGTTSCNLEGALCGAAGSHVRQPTRNISASPYPILTQFSRKYHEKQQKRQFGIQNQQKSLKNTAKTTNSC